MQPEQPPQKTMGRIRQYLTTVSKQESGFRPAGGGWPGALPSASVAVLSYAASSLAIGALGARRL